MHGAYRGNCRQLFFVGIRYAHVVHREQRIDECLLDGGYVAERQRGVLMQTFGYLSVDKLVDQRSYRFGLMVRERT